MTILYTDIGELVTNDPTQGDGSPARASSPTRRWSSTATGSPGSGRAPSAPAADAPGRAAPAPSVIPGFVDSHAHLVFAGDRSAEFAARMSGEPYDGGGIATTVAATRAADDADADRRRRTAGRRTAARRRDHLRDQERLRSDRRRRGPLRCRSPATVTDETTFLGAHVVPAEFRDDRDGYVDLVVGDMLDACAPAARWVDVFCDRGAFDVDEARAHPAPPGIAAGLVPRLHAGQLGPERRYPTRRRTRCGVGRPLHLRHRRRRRGARRASTPRSPRCCPGPSSPPARSGRTRRRFARRRGHRRAGDRLQPGQLVHHEHVVLHRGRGAGHEFHSRRRRCGRRRRAERPPCGATTSESSPRAGAPTSCASTRRPTYIWPTGPVCRWFATWSRVGSNELSQRVES